ncbi:MAG: helix-turn-helix transcriptional regulator [Flavitalea sp.]
MQDDHFPLLGIQEFSEGRNADDLVLFNELHGQREIIEPHKHDFLIIILFQKGSGVHTIDFTDYKISSNQLHLVFPGQVHHWKIHKGTVAFQVMISKSQFQSVLQDFHFSPAQYHQHPVTDLDQNSYNKLFYEFQAVKEELNLPDVSWKIVQQRCSLLALLINRVVASVTKSNDPYRSNPVLAQYIALIDVHFRDQRSVSFYASQIGVTANYLNVLCRKLIDIPASVVIQSRVLLEAKRLLRASTLSMKEIVYELGFYDNTSFSKFFRTHSGVTPTAFREGKGS